MSNLSQALAYVSSRHNMGYQQAKVRKSLQLTKDLCIKLHIHPCLYYGKVIKCVQNDRKQGLVDEFLQNISNLSNYFVILHKIWKLK